MRAGAAVFFAGLGVMAAEILTSRLLAPTFGASLTTWSVLIAVTLLLGSLGAWAGGLLATRGPSPWLVAAFATAGVGFGLAALDLARGLGTRLTSLPLGALVTSTLLLVPIVLPLAAVLPLASVSSASGRVTPRRLGGLLALSTAGSLVGTLGAALVLVPDLGLQLSFVGLAAVSALAAAVMARRVLPRLALLVIALTALAWLAFEGTHPRHEGIRETAFGRVELRRTPQAIELRVDGVLQGAHSPLTVGRGTLLRARQYVELLPFLHPRGRRAVCIGLGSGVVPRTLEAYGIGVESIDINPFLVDLARTTLGYDGAVQVGDGRRLLRQMVSSFDFVVIDAFQGEVLPAHLVTREAFAEARARLTPGGILCLHLIGRPEHAMTSAVSATLGSVFEHQLAVRAGVADELQDVYLFASDAPLNVQPQPELRAAGWIGNEIFQPKPDGQILTDDRNPVDRLNEPLARALRRASM